MALVPTSRTPLDVVPDDGPVDRLLIAPQQRTPYTDWYVAQIGQVWAEPAQNAYRKAIETLKKELNPEELQIIGLAGQNSMQDVQRAVTVAVHEYESRPKASKVREWLVNCSSRIKYYEAVFDTLAQHYPEFTSLAWGSFKFLFMTILNHEELLGEISKAISSIADMLPRTELLLDLYPTERIQEAVAQVYAKIIEFAIMAIKWYKKGKLKHSVAAIVHPFKLSFQPVIEEISRRSRRVDELASAACKAEIRDQHAKIHKLERRMSQLMELMIAHQSLQNEILVDLRDQKQVFRNAQLEDIHHLMIEDGALDSSDSLEFCRSMKTRRVQKLATQLPMAEIPKLKAWLDDPASSVLLAESKGIRSSSLDFAVEFLGAVQDRDYPIIWALPTAFEDSSSLPTVMSILRSLVLQVLQLNPAAMTATRNPVTIRHLRSATTIEQWFQILERCIVPMPALFIVIDIGLIEKAVHAAVNDDDDESDDDSPWHERQESFKVGDFVNRMSELAASRQKGRLKIIIAAVSFRDSTSLEFSETFGDMRVTTDMGRQIGRLMRQPKYRGVFKLRTKKMAYEIRATLESME